MAKEIYTYKELEDGDGVKIPVDENIKKHRRLRVRFKTPPATYTISNPRTFKHKTLGLMLAGDEDDGAIRVLQVKGIVWVKPLCEHWKYGTSVLCPEEDIWAIDEQGRPKRFKQS